MEPISTKATIVDTLREERTTFLINSLDAFDPAPAKTFFAPGHHIVRLKGYELVPEKEVADEYTETTHVTKPYILLELADVHSRAATEYRLYQGFLPYFDEQIAAQTEGAISGMTRSEILEYLRTHDFEIWVTYSKSRGVQVNFREPR